MLCQLVELGNSRNLTDDYAQNSHWTLLLAWIGTNLEIINLGHPSCLITLEIMWVQDLGPSPNPS